MNGNQCELLDKFKNFQRIEEKHRGTWEHFFFWKILI
jgi:hypothetical protein